jgi:hypothetical protein
MDQQLDALRERIKELEDQASMLEREVSPAPTTPIPAIRYP